MTTRIKVTLTAALVLALVSCATDPLAALREQYPDPDLSIQDVVLIQLQALQNNNSENDGIEIVYRFAAPANKAATGPLPRFALLFASPQYSPMLGAERIELLEFRSQGNLALQGSRIVGRNGEERYYLFVLQRQEAGEFDGCWMTVAVQNYSGAFPGNEYVPESQSI
jgi:hypothetical protein